MLKVAGGKYRSRLLEVPFEVTIPTKSMVREALANALRSKIEDAIVLDMFAGSGALGIEMISRGSKKAYFVDKSIEASKIIKRNLETLKIVNSEVLNADYQQIPFLIKEKIGIVFMDPPYKDKDFYQRGIDLLLNNGLLKDDGVIVLEYENELNVNEAPFKEIRNYHYGRTKIKILWREK